MFAKRQQNTSFFGVATPNPVPRDWVRGKKEDQSKISTLDDTTYSKLGKFLEAPVRITTDAPGAAWAHFSKKKKKETGLQYYMHIGVLSINNLIYHYYMKKKSNWRVIIFRINLFLLPSSFYNLAIDSPPFDGS